MGEISGMKFRILLGFIKICGVNCCALVREYGADQSVNDKDELFHYCDMRKFYIKG